MNRITVHGRLGMDPEIRVANGYKGDFTVCNISIACNRHLEMIQTGSDVAALENLQKLLINFSKRAMR